MLKIKKLFAKILNAIIEIRSTLTVQTINSNVTTTTGRYVSSTCRRYGNVVYLQLIFYNTASVGAGSNLYQATFTNVVPRPIVNCTGAGFYGSHSTPGSLTTGRVVTVRNASSTALTIGSSNTCAVTFTYITND